MAPSGFEYSSEPILLSSLQAASTLSCIVLTFLCTSPSAERALMAPHWMNSGTEVIISDIILEMFAMVSFEETAYPILNPVMAHVFENEEVRTNFFGVVSSTLGQGLSVYSLYISSLTTVKPRLSANSTISLNVPGERTFPVGLLG